LEFLNALPDKDFFNSLLWVEFPQDQVHPMHKALRELLKAWAQSEPRI
jgi:hypothetical protein